MIEYGIKEQFDSFEFEQPNHIGMLLLSAHLFKTLPNYIPK